MKLLDNNQFLLKSEKFDASVIKGSVEQNKDPFNNALIYNIGF